MRDRGGGIEGMPSFGHPWPMPRGGGRWWGERGRDSMYSSSSYHMTPPGRPLAPPSRREPLPITRMLSTVLMRSPVSGRLE